MNYLKSVEAFVLAAEKGNFSAVADAMEITPAMVGRYIRDLEARLGGTLIHRTTRKQGLTEVGQQFYQYGVQILSTIKEADAVVQHLNETVVGNIRISAPVAYGNHVLTPIIGTFLKRYPKVNIDLVLSDRKVDLIAERFELAIRIGDILDDGVIAHPLPPYQMVMVASPTYLEQHGTPDSPEALSQHHCISFSQWHANHRWVLENHHGRYPIDIEPRLIVNSGEAIRQAALTGLGIAVNSVVTLAADLQAGRLIRVLPDYQLPARPMHLVRTPIRPTPPAITAFIDHLQQALCSTTALDSNS